MARIVSERLGPCLAKPSWSRTAAAVPAAASVSKFVASADPDGYTILMTPGGSLTTGPAVHKSIGYDPVQGVHAGVPADRDAADHRGASEPAGEDDGRAGCWCARAAIPGKLSWGSRGLASRRTCLLELVQAPGRP